jgi:hypothetical protein
MPRSGELAIALSLTLAAIAAGYALYSDVRPVDSGAGRSIDPPRQWSAMQTEPVGEPLRVANPFDSSEVFEFPAGTTEADARDAVAGFLLERATRRGAARDHRHAGPKG